MSRCSAQIVTGTGSGHRTFGLGCGGAVVAPGAQVEKLAGDFKFTEGPTCDAGGNVFFTDQPNDRIMKWSVDGKLPTFLQPAGRANGMYFDANGQLIACADEKTALWSIAPDGRATVLRSDYGDKKLNGPNDVWVRPDGALYFTDPFYKRPWWTHDAMPQDGQHVYFLSADRQRLVRVAGDLRQPNGIIGTPDGKTLYVADIGAKKTYRFDIAPDGKLAGKTLVVEQGSDGMTLDAEGNLYLTGNGGPGVRQGRPADRPHPGSRRALDGKRQLLREGPPHAVHHGEHGPVFGQDARAGGEPVEVASNRVMEEPLMVGRWKAGRVLVAALSLVAVGAHVLAAQSTPKPFEPASGQAGKDVVWVPTPQATVDKMLDLTKVTANDYVIDLGSGDGVTVITAAKRGATALGVEFNPDMVALAKRRAQEAGVPDRATFVEGDLFEAHLSKATVITLFLLPEINLRLRPKLLDLAPGTRIASNSFTMGDWEPDAQATASPCPEWCTVLTWVVPAKVAGTWQLGQRTLRLKQRYQVISGTLGSTPITAGRLSGASIRFTAGKRRYTGRVEGDTMTGTGWSATRK